MSKNGPLLLYFKKGPFLKNVPVKIFFINLGECFFCLKNSVHNFFLIVITKKLNNYKLEAMKISKEKKKKETNIQV